MCGRLAALSLAVLAACQGSGRVRVVLSAPADESLDPTPEGSLAEITLVASSPGVPDQVARRRVAGERRLEFGEVAARPGIRLSVLATAASGRLLGFGRSAAAIDVEAGEDVDVTVELRRPFAYVGGGSSLVTLDTTLDSPGYRGAVALPDPVAAATLPDGSHVLVAAGGVLRLVSTFTHLPVDQANPPPLADVVDLAVSPDGRRAVALTSTGDVAIVDLDALRAGRDATPTIVAVPGAARLAVGAETAYVLADVDPARCDLHSRVVRIPLDAPTPLPDLPLPALALDLAIDPAGETLYVPFPCEGTVNRVQIAGDTPSTEIVIMLPVPGSVAVAAGRIWAVGSELVGNGQRLVIASVGTDGAGGTRLELPTTEERAISLELTEAGHSAEMRLEADELLPSDLTVLPDGRQVALLVHAKFHAPETIEPVEVFPGVIVDEVILPEMDIDTREYLLLDTAAGTVVQRLRTRCQLTWVMMVAFIDQWACGVAPGQDVISAAADQFVPRRLAVLYGEQ